MTKVSSPSLMASLGHSGSQTPQLMHSSVIIVAMLWAPSLGAGGQ